VLAEAGAGGRVLAGGTDVLVQLREGRRHVDVLVDIKAIAELNELSFSQSDGLRLGAAAPCCTVYEHRDVQHAYPILVDSASLIGGTAIQGRATLGGNLCNASPAADGIPSLIALGATCVIAGPNGRRTVPVEHFCISPGRSVLEHGELLVGMDIPTPKRHSGGRFLRFIPRNEMDIAVVNAAAVVELDTHANIIRHARLALGAVAPQPLFLEDASQALEGVAATAEGIAHAVELAKAAAKPIGDTRGTIAQRRHLAEVMMRRAIEGAIERAKGN
jgi:carbon-monoxide dehydrogenase medium subunit